MSSQEIIKKVEADVAYSRSAKASLALTVLGILLVMSSLAWNYLRLQRAQREYESIQNQIERSRADLELLQRKQVDLEKKSNGLTLALNDVVNSDKSAYNALDQAAANSAVSNFVPRIFLHSNGNDQPELVETAANNLRAAGFIVPKPDNERNGYDPTHLQIRWFSPNNDTAHSDAKLISDTLDSSGLRGAYRQWGYDDEHYHPPRTYSVYLPRNR